MTTPSGQKPMKLQAALDTATRLAERAKRKQKVYEQNTPPAQVQMMLPAFHPDDRVIPNALARGAIFNACKTGDSIKREFYENKIVASLSSLKIEYRGQELRQDDCSVFIALLYFQQDIALGQPIYFSAYEMLNELGWTLNQREYQHLRECCGRLSATNLTIAFGDGSEGFAGSLLRNFAWKDDDSKALSKWCVQFEPAIARFFREDSFSIIDPKIRRMISGRAPLAQWLHSFFSTHQEPFPMSVAKYHELSKSNSKDLSDFRGRLKTALHRLVETGFLVKFEIRDDMVHVKRVKFNRPAPVYRQPLQIENA